jgi:hypothetical protein
VFTQFAESTGRDCKSNRNIKILFLRSALLLLVTANAVRSSPVPVTLLMETIIFSKTSVLTRATRCHIPEDAIFLVRFEVFTAVTMKNGVLLRRVALVRTNVSEEPGASFIRVTWYFFAAYVGC